MTIRPGTTVEFEAGKPLKIIKYTPGLAGAKPPGRLPTIIRTRSCVPSARG